MQSLNNGKNYLEKKEPSEFNDINKIKLKIEKMLKTFFKEEPSLFIYYIINDEKKIEKNELNPFEKNRIILEIKNWKKYFSNNNIIELYLDVIKSNNIQSSNLNQILNEINYNNNFFFAENNNTDIKMQTISDQSDQDEESLQLSSSIISLENILNINVNKAPEEKKSGSEKSDEEYESSCNAEYFESINFLPLDESKDIEMKINSKNKENNNMNNIRNEINMSYNKKNLENDKGFNAMEYLKKKTKTKSHISN